MSHQVLVSVVKKPYWLTLVVIQYTIQYYTIVKSTTVLLKPVLYCLLEDWNMENNNISLTLLASLTFEFMKEDKKTLQRMRLEDLLNLLI